MIKSKLLISKNIEEVKLIDYEFDGTFHLFKTSFKKIQEKPGLYLLIFSNGKKYVGQTDNIFRRLNQHYDKIKKPAKNNWYKEVHDYLIQQCELNGENFKHEFLENTTLMLQYTNTKEEARLLEKQALNEICINGFKDEYYNLKFY